MTELTHVRRISPVALGILSGDSVMGPFSLLSTHSPLHSFFEESFVLGLKSSP